jgi:formate dehydrogenase iron-sulfur subunit
MKSPGGKHAGMGMLIDTNLCEGCGACEDACRETNGLPADSKRELSKDRFTVLKQENGISVRRMCMHCESPSCASVCPVKAIEKTELGPVVYDASKCMGCRYCMVACPFGVPKYEWDKPVPTVRKCSMCYDRQLQGKIPACAEACPTGATKFGPREELIKTARERIAAEPGKYHNGIYGLDEAGGTSILYISSVPFNKLGLPVAVLKEPYPERTWRVLSKIPKVVVVGGVVLTGIWWITNRRNEVRQAEGGRNGGGK